MKQRLLALIPMCLIAGLALTAILAHAQTGPPPGGVDIFSLMDSDSDGYVTQSEFLAAETKRAQQMWSTLDSSGAGKLSQTDLLNAMRNSMPKPPAPQGSN